MSKLLTVFGATGQQGGSVIDHVLNDPKLSKEWTIRACTRNPSSISGAALKSKGVEVVAADVEDRASIKKAVEGSEAVFAVTVSIYDRETAGKEIEQGKAIADACVEAGVKQIVWSTSSHTDRISNDKYTKCTIFNYKADVEDYIRTLPIKATYFAPASFMQNFIGQSKPRPSQANDGTYAITNVLDETTKIPLIDVAADSGKFVAAALEEPEKYDGKILSAGQGFYTLPEIAAAIGRVTGETVKYRRAPDDVYVKFLPPSCDDAILQMWQFMRDFGYYGPDQEEKVEWSAKQARGDLVTLDEFLARSTIDLGAGK